MSRIAEIDPAALDRWLDHKAGSSAPGLAVGITHHGETVYRGARGLASVEQDTPLTAATRMRIASVSKQFTAYAFLTLCRAGRADLDAPIGRYVERLHHSVAQTPVRQLLGHVSGLCDIQDIRYHLGGTVYPASAETMLGFYREHDGVIAPPLESWRYNNGGFMLVSLAIEAISGQSFDDYLREQVFAPLGMGDTLLRRWDTAFVRRSAALHSACGNGEFERLSVNKEHLGEGGIATTIDDLLRWLTHLIAPGTSNKELVTALAEPQRLANGICTGYGLGLATCSYRGLDLQFHTGGLLGGNAILVAVPDLSFGIAVMTNRSDLNSSALAEELIASCITDLDPLDRNRGAPATIAADGLFRCRASGRIARLRNLGYAPWLCLDGEDIALRTDSRGDILAPASPWDLRKLEVAVGETDARARILIITEFGHRLEFEEIEQDNGAPLDPLIGQYRGSLFKAELQIDFEGTRARMNVSSSLGRVTFGLASFNEAIWHFQAIGPEPWAGIVVHDRNKRQLTLTTARTHALQFEKVR